LEITVCDVQTGRKNGLAACSFRKLEELEQKTEALALRHDSLAANTRVQLRQVFDALRELMTPPEPKRRPIGFTAQEDKKRD